MEKGPSLTTFSRSSAAPRRVNVPHDKRLAAAVNLSAAAAAKTNDVTSSIESNLSSLVF